MKRALATIAVALHLCASTAYAAGEYEPNDERRQATGPLAGATNYEAGLETSNDIDWYVFYPRANQQLDIATTSLENTLGEDRAIEVELKNARGITLRSTHAFDGGTTEHIRYSPRSRGPLYLKVARASYLSSSAGQRYRLRIDPGGSLINPDPYGDLNGIAGHAAAGSISIAGWAIDGSAPRKSILIHVYLDGQFLGARRANVSRPDVAEAFQGVGKAHGFSALFRNISPGTHTIDVFGINVRNGTNKHIEGATVTVPGSILGSTSGRFEKAFSKRPRSATLKGWTFDPDDKRNPTDLHVYVDAWAGSGAQGFNLGSARRIRRDVARKRPGLGSRHGFLKQVKLTPGTHVLYAYAINRAGGGENSLIGVQKVRVKGKTP